MHWQLPSFGFECSILITKLWLIYFSSAVLNGCALHYYDTESGAEHIYGIGHLVMKASPSQDDQQALIRGSDLLGFQAGKTDEGYTFGLGWNRHRRIDVLSSDKPLVLEWPDADFLNLRIGSDPSAPF